MTRFLIIDTCVWIGLAGEPKLYGLLETLNISLKETDFILILPESVKVEFERHRDSIKSVWKNKCKSLVSNIKQINKHFPSHAEELLIVHHKIQNTLAQSSSNIEDNLKQMPIPIELLYADFGKAIAFSSISMERIK
ncbi:hypothetical protein [Nostoc sp. CALU 1950]|uniref:hypothetical protein n=1 Tax=Nostoc sp. CALU 1950 TaxID=3104321 RepID=UPI003EBAEFB5